VAGQQVQVAPQTLFQNRDCSDRLQGAVRRPGAARLRFAAGEPRAHLRRHQAEEEN